MLILVATLALARLGAADFLALHKYVEARTSFAQAALYLQERLPDRNLTYLNPEDRLSLSLGILAGLTGDLVLEYQLKKTYKPLDTLQERLPFLWTNYLTVANNLRDSLQTAQLNVSPVTSLIDGLCNGENDLDKCNQLVDKAVNKRPDLYEPVAELLLKLGKASNDFNAVTERLELVLRENSEIPTFLQHLNDEELVTFVKEAADLHTLLKSVDAVRKTNAS